MSFTPLFAITADVHLAPHIWSSHRDIYGDSYASWEYIIRSCVTNRLPLVVLGDLFDSKNPPSEALAVYRQGVEDMQRANLPLYYIQGNHEVSSPPWASHHPWAHWLHDTVQQFGPYRVASLDYMPSSTLSGCIQALWPFDVFLGHQSWRELQSIGKVDASFEVFPSSCFVVSGDFHVCRPFVGRAADGMTVSGFSPGSVAMQAINEETQKHFCVLGVGERGEPTVVKHAIPTRQCFFTTCHTEEQLIYALREIESACSLDFSALDERIRKPLIRVKYAESVINAYNRIEAAIAGRAFPFLDMLAGTEKAAEQAQEYTGDQQSQLIEAAKQLGWDDPESVELAVFALNHGKQAAEMLDQQFKQQLA